MQYETGTGTRLENRSLTRGLSVSTRWFKYDREKLWLVYTQISPGHIWTTSYYVAGGKICNYAYGPNMKKLDIDLGVAWSLSITLRPLSLQEGTLLRVAYETGWAVRTLDVWEKYLIPDMNRTLDYPVCTLVATSVELYRLQENL
jgi:hypothetical protein